MKKFFTLVFAFSFLFITSAFSQVLLQENFTADAGTLLTAAGWNQTGTSSATPVAIVSPGLTLPGYDLSGIGNAAQVGTSGQDVNKSFSDTAVATGSLYAAFLVNVTSAQTAGDYFIHFMQSPTNTFAFFGRVFVKQAANGKLAFGLSKSSASATIPAAYSDSVYSTGTTYLLVLKYTFGPDTTDDATSLFINPALLATEPTPTLTHNLASGNDPEHLGAIALRQGSASNAASVKVDGIRVATTWKDAVSDVITIAEARQDLNGDLIPDRLHAADSTVHVRGVVISPNFQTANRSYYIWDGTAGIDVFRTGLNAPALNLGDEVQVLGYIDQYRGLTEVNTTADSNIVVLSDSNALPAYQELTIAQFKANPEAYEGELIAVKNLNKASGNWPAAGSSATLKMTDGTDTIDVQIDSDTDIDGNPEPTWPKDIVGIAGQFANPSNTLNTGYQILPRYFAADILPAGTIPVELTSFTASYSSSAVTLQWRTATETNNRGFEVQRKSANGSFQAIAFVRGGGSTSEKSVYSYTDRSVENGKYSYRLKQIDFSGTFTYSNEVEVNAAQPNKFSLDQNYPNPFNPSTTISFSLPVESKVTLKVFNVLGQEVASLLNGSISAGLHRVNFDAFRFNSGVYFYKITANGIDGSAYSMIKKMTLTK